MALKTAARYLDCSTGQIGRLIRQGDLRCHTLTKGGDRRISRRELDAYIARREMEGVK